MMKLLIFFVVYCAITIFSTTSTLPHCPKSYCFTSFGVRRQRPCIPAQPPRTTPKPETFTLQERSSAPCGPPEHSLITPKLLELENMKDESNVTIQCNEISQNFSMFNYFDVYLAGEYFFIEKHNLNIQMLALDAFDNILNIEDDIFLESQAKTRGTDNLLKHFKPFNIDTTFKGNNFAGISASIHDSVIVNKNSKLVKFEVFEELLFYPDLSIAVYVNSDHLQLYYFFNEKLFLSNSSHDTTYVIFASFERESTSSQPTSITVVYRFSQSEFLKTVDCLEWNLYHEWKPGFWQRSGSFEIREQNFLCTFPLNKYSALALSPPQNLTQSLKSILFSNMTITETISRLYQLSYRFLEFKKYDVELVSLIFQKIAKSSEEIRNFNLLGQILSNLQDIPKAELVQSQLDYLATDAILDYCDKSIQNYHSVQRNFANINDNFITVILDLLQTDLIGFGLTRNNEIEILTNNSINSENFTCFLTLSPELIAQLNYSEVIVNIFKSDAFFNEIHSDFSNKIVSRVFDVILPIVGNLSGPISIFHKSHGEDRLYFCCYWLYNSTVPGHWKVVSEGSNYSDWIQCNYSHTTHFALLIVDKDYLSDDVPLEWLTNINASLSILGFLGIFVTAMLFRSWRNKSGNRILLHFVSSGLLQIVAFYFSSLSKKYSNFCIVTGIFVHYMVLAQFFWTLVIALLQFKRFVKVLGTYSPNILLKSCLFAWGLPLLPIIIILSLGFNIYKSGKTGLCYPVGLGLYLGVWLPLILVICINLIFYCRIIRAVWKKGPDSTAFGRDEIIYQWRLVFFLFYILDLTWIFGFLAEIQTALIFVYLFCIFATLQGFVMFLFFVVFNKNVKELYKQKFCKKY